VLVFLLNGLVFLLIGLQLRIILEGLSSHEPLTLLVDGGLVCLTVVQVRIGRVVLAAFPLRLFERYLGSRIQQPSWRNVLIVAWTGMRGGVLLAAALALPLTLVSGRPFPQRDLVTFLTFCVILAMLVGQGLSLAPLIRVLHLQQDGSLEQMAAFYQLVRQAYPWAKRIWLMQDNWPVHFHPDVLRALEEQQRLYPVKFPRHGPRF
jgi:NhaP-type Na+/H+ or K+/H+ antiporter